MSASHRGTRRCLAPAGWTPEMDALLTDGLAQRLTYRAIGELMRTNGFGDRSADAVRERAKRLDLVATDGLTEGPLDCRRSGADPLLAALARAHDAPPADVPVATTSVPVNGRLLVPVSGGAGSPGALCAEGGQMAKGW
ncbi:hypothetical protein AncyloWKF20_05245 [Ancylobacter sp. WKF20]|uniref:hypothetical protein n=1 Tax=Ancylobacter sp. WKF20 TaxID=3039801 RepID=UPI0024343B4C|nr:hypothetical protein [Ancylobacter sp. WKF20]WGD31230.1 hypothetical protein AncyloWKF20_05245 [Ancylobacter sp. WKF20]